ncbi:hypothetical protein V6N12_046487 [Hibiscus sabdariffa]|uniref:Uncharacterized protein n=1 Tax=Hibiscus sabdariffa TaxID=183260 RepID=A0ABR2DIT7_9ROSI
MGFESDSCGLSGLLLMRSLCWAAQDNILIRSRSLLTFLFCLDRESRQIIFLLISRSFQSELLQYNFLHLDPAAFGFYQGLISSRQIA